MFYKHWKKIALTLTALFWASCSETTEEGVLYGCPPNGCYDEPESSDSNNDESSSSETSGEQSSSSEENTSSSSEAVKPESSSEATEESSSSDVTCVPGDSLISYYPPSYSADIAKMDAEETAKYESSLKIDSIVNTLQTAPRCLANLRQELDDFIALYGAPKRFHKDEVCSDGITRPTQEYLDYLTMKEEWEKNKPALDEECQKIYEDKLKEIEAQINQCLATSNPNTDLTVCDLEAMCPVYGATSKCINNYQCKDGVSCTRTDGETDINCIDKQGESVTYTKSEFNRKYYTKERH